jgi:hypothetical protein
MDSLLNFYQTFKEELPPMFLKLLHKIGKEVMLPNSFCKSSITLKLKIDKDINKKRKQYTKILDGHRYKYPQQNTCQPKSTVH